MPLNVGGALGETEKTRLRRSAPAGRQWIQKAGNNAKRAPGLVAPGRLNSRLLAQQIKRLVCLSCCGVMLTNKMADGSPAHSLVSAGRQRKHAHCFAGLSDKPDNRKFRHGAINLLKAPLSRRRCSGWIEMAVTGISFTAALCALSSRATQTRYGKPKPLMSSTDDHLGALSQKPWQSFRQRRKQLNRRALLSVKVGRAWRAKGLSLCEASMVCPT